MSVEVIVEPGACHDGTLDRMLALVDVAAEAGATAFKPQFWSNSQRLADRRHMAAEDPYRAIYDRYRVPLVWLPLVAEHARVRGLECFCTVYLPEDVRTVFQACPYISAFKVSSFEADDDDLRLAIQRHGMRQIVSTGMSMRSFRGELCDVLHCVSAYPAPLDALNLRVVQHLDGGCRQLFDGFSDHSRDVRVGAWAVAAGARILEVHARLDDTDPANPDFATALTPSKLQTYIANVRDCERALGDGVKRTQECELPMLAYKVRS